IAQGMQETLVTLSPQKAQALQKIKLISLRSRQKQLQKQLELIVGDKTFADLRIPVKIMCTDMVRAEEIVMDEGPLLPALLATCAVPGVFPPVHIGEQQLVDGGVVDSLATHVAFEPESTKIIAVDVYPSVDTETPWIDPFSSIMGIQLPFDWFNGSDKDGTIKYPNVISYLWRATRVLIWNYHEDRLRHAPPNILLRPDVDDYGSLDFTELDGPIQAGVEVTEKHLLDIQALLDGDTPAPNQITLKQVSNEN
ncbi:MAG: patatin-like phospholipase family protein, partial [Chloroflexota bacterium]